MKKKRMICLEELCLRYPEIIEKTRKETLLKELIKRIKW